MSDLKEHNIKDIISQNKKRNDIINQPYNPITGLNAVGIRKFVHVENSPIPGMYLPIEMIKENKWIRLFIKYGLVEFSRKYIEPEPTEETLNDIWIEFIKCRIIYDFEFWSYSFIPIKDKTSPNDIPFKLNRAQRKVLEKLESLRKAGKPIKFILLKARQWGGSTLVIFYQLWIMLVHRRNWNTVLCGDVETQSRNVRAMLTKALKKYPAYLLGEPIRFTPFEGSSKNKIIQNTNCIISIGSAQKPDTLRSGDISGAHLTEVGVWKETKGKKPEDLIQSIIGSIYDTEYTFLGIESTAKGVGNYFHRTWEDAVKGKNNLLAIFVAWFDIDIYTKEIKNYNEFINSLDEYEWYLWELGATLEAINWYRWKKKDVKELWRMNSEFPSTPNEAFQSTGRRRFRLEDTIKLKETCIDPMFKGDISGLEETGYSSLSNIKLHKDEKGNLFIWKMPQKNKNRYINRYVVIMDVGGVSDTADYTDILVLDRYWMIEGGVPEVVAEWHGHIDHDKGAWKAVQIAMFYGNGDALLVIESNTLETEGTEGDNFEYILDEISGIYTNLYSRTPADQIRQGIPAKWGFHTNSSTKPMVISHQVKAVRDGLYIEREIEAVEEHDTFEIKENGKTMGAVEGKYDDRLMTRAIGVWICYRIDLPKIILSSKENSNRIIISEATI